MSAAPMRSAARRAAMMRCIPQLGTLDDFRALIAAAKRAWAGDRARFRHPVLARPSLADASIRTGSAGVPTDRCATPRIRRRNTRTSSILTSTPRRRLPALWLALRDVVQFWVDQGVRIFRVDNPHTKPLPFWHWMIADIHGRASRCDLPGGGVHPAEADVPAGEGRLHPVLHLLHLAQHEAGDHRISDRAERTPPVREFFRPNFFVNTPDINPLFLQTSGRPGFLIRAALAARCPGCGACIPASRSARRRRCRAARNISTPKSIEIRVRDFAAPGNIVAEITALNRIRRAHPALQIASRRDVLSSVQRPGAAVWQADTGEREHDPGRGQPRPARRAGGGNRNSAVGMGPARPCGARGDRSDARPPFRLVPASSSASGSIPPICRSASGRSHRLGSTMMDDRRRPPLPHAPRSRAERGRAVVQGRDHLPAARQVVLRCQQRRHRRFRRADLASWTTSPIWASTRSGCCRSIPRRGWTMATTSPTIAASIRTTARWPTSGASSPRRMSAACG